MAEFTELWRDGPLFAQAEHFKLSTDSVLLANYVSLSGIKSGIDLGSASGFIPLSLMVRKKSLHMTGLEILPEAGALAEENYRINGLSDRGKSVTGDIRNVRSLFKSGSFDLVTANPPYFPQGTGPVSPDTGRAGARSEICCSLEDICAAAEYLLHTGGSLYLVHKPERLADVILAVSSHGMAVKRLRTVSSKWGRAPSLFLLEARRGGASGMKLEAPLLLCNEDGSESEEYKKIYHREL